MFKGLLLNQFVLLLIFISQSGCSTTGRSIPDQHELPFEGSQSPRLKAKKIWSQELPGKLTDLSVSASGDRILVTQVLEGQAPGGTKLSLRGSDGSVLWTLPIDSPVRTQTLSASGEWIMIGTYDDELIRIDGKTGKKLWSVEDSGMCRPMILEKSQQVLCYHDDDSVPGTAFSIFDAHGKPRNRFRVPMDLLVLKVSSDESQIALGMVRGKVWILNSSFKKIGERDAGGEIVDLGISNSPTPGGGDLEARTQWSALVNVHGVGQKLIGMSSSGKTRWEQLLDSPHQQLELSDDGSSTALYGNGPKGQLVSLWGVTTQGRFSPIWSYRSPRYADYNQRIDLSGEDTVLGFEEVTDRTRHSHVVALQHSGKLDWDIPLISEDGAYLYARGYSSKAGLVVVGTDDGVLSAYSLQR